MAKVYYHLSTLVRHRRSWRVGKSRCSVRIALGVWIRPVDQIGRATVDPLGNSWGRDPFSEIALGIGTSLLDPLLGRSFRLDESFFNTQTLASGGASFGADDRNYDSMQRAVRRM